ncbi:MAG: hypothetical protein U9Q03_00055 [Patescibacteria group bacterium]|nr:hypothetical protein [Patescibacteria group bacterium]
MAKNFKEAGDYKLWVDWTHQYLYLARLGCQVALDNKPKYFRDDRGIMKYGPESLCIPIIFNFKHGIELSLKALSIIVDKKKEYERGHDISKLFTTLKSHLEDEKLKIEESGGNKVKIDDSKSKIEGIVEKYRKGGFFKNRWDVVIQDKMNDLFRYPEGNSATASINDKNFCKEDVKNLEEDIVKFSEAVNFLGYLYVVS